MYFPDITDIMKTQCVLVYFVKVFCFTLAVFWPVPYGIARPCDYKTHIF